MTTTDRIPTPAAVVLLALAAACSDAPQADARPDAAPTPVVAPAAASALDEARALGVMNPGEPSPGILTAGQLTQAQFEALAEAGYTRFVSLQLPTEQGAGWEEAFAAGRGLSFERIPVGGADGLTRENASALDHALEAAEGGKTVVYCASSNRVGALFAMKAHWVDGATPEEAMALGKAAGMTRLEADVARLLGAAGGTR